MSLINHNREMLAKSIAYVRKCEMQTRAMRFEATRLYVEWNAFNGEITVESTDAFENWNIAAEIVAEMQTELEIEIENREWWVIQVANLEFIEAKAISSM